MSDANNAAIADVEDASKATVKISRRRPFKSKGSDVEEASNSDFTIPSSSKSVTRKPKVVEIKGYSKDDFEESSTTADTEEASNYNVKFSIPLKRLNSRTKETNKVAPDNFASTIISTSKVKGKWLSKLNNPKKLKSKTSVKSIGQTGSKIRSMGKGLQDEDSSVSSSRSVLRKNPRNFGSKTSTHEKKKHKAKKQTITNVIRLRGQRNEIFKFRKIGEGAESVLTEDPLDLESIKKATNFREWARQANLALPSTVGVPVETNSDVLNAGVGVLEENRRWSLGQKDIYNKIYDEAKKLSFTQEIRKSLIDSRTTKVNEDALGLAKATFAKKLAALREFAENLSEKRIQKRELIQSLEDQYTSEAVKPSIRERFESFLVKVHRFIRDMQNILQFWKSDVQHVHGKFGMGAAAYFIWLRVIFSFNLIYAFIVLVFILIPEVCLTKVKVNGTCLPEVVALESCVLLPTIKRTEDVEYFDFLSGKGFLEGSLLYYSGYQDTVAAPYCPEHKLDIPRDEMPALFSITAFRFTFVYLLIFIVNSIFVALQVKKFYHREQMETKIPGLGENGKFMFLFFAWDFNCTDRMGASMVHRSIWRDIKVVLSEVEANGKKQKHIITAKKPGLEDFFLLRMGVERKYLAYFVHGTCHFASFSVIASTVYLFYRAFQIREHWIDQRCTDLHELPNWMLMLPSIIFSFLYDAVCKICQLISQYESWESLENKNFVLVARVGLYYLFNFFIIYIYWFRRAPQLLGNLCAEEYFGQEIYRLIWIQGIVDLLLSFISSRLYPLIMKRIRPEYSKPAFDASSSTLNVMFLHTLSGVGFLFCPLISILLSIRLFWTFYHHKYMLMNLSRFPTHATHNSEIQAPYLIAFIVSYLTTTCFNILLLSKVNPSQTCGPFSHFREEASDHEGHYWQVFTESLNSRTSGVFSLFMNPGVVIVVAIILSAVCYTLKVWGKAYVQSMENLYHYLILERKDRHFLLEAIYQTVKKREAEENHTKPQRRSTKSKSIAFAASPLLGFESERNKRQSWVDTTLAQGIFEHRRGTIPLSVLEFELGLARYSDSSFQELDEDATAESVLNFEVDDLHSTVGRLLKTEFHWLPSEWKRRHRRSAITDTNRKKILKEFTIALDGDDTTPSEVKVEGRSSKKKQKISSTVGKLLKTEFHWLPSEWKRRDRRSAITDTNRKKILKEFTIALDEDDITPSEVKVEGRSSKKKQNI